MIFESIRRVRALQAPNAVAKGRFYASISRLKASPEQLAVVKWLKTHNVIVSARPGAGKTAAAEVLVRENPNMPIAVITYSRRLRLDTKERLEGYQGVETYTFHGLAGHLFGRTIRNDTDLIMERSRRSIPHIDNFLKYRYIVLDEIQDLTDDLYWLASTFIASLARRRGGQSPRILALGDSRQAIYDFRGADPRFLEQADTIFRAVSPYDWKHLPLHQSFRLSRPTADFINNGFLGGEPYLVGTGDGPKPLYIRADLTDTKDLSDFLRDYIQHYGAENCAILSPSVRNKGSHHYLGELTNHLSRSGIRVSVSVYDDAPLDEDVIRGKLVVSSYHQFKGSERDLVIVFGADDSWFEWFGRHYADDSCPNAVFVALTRARKQVLGSPSIRLDCV